MEHWSEYWCSNAALNSFAEGENAAGYMGGVASYWNSVFSVLPYNARLLDIGTGNGALAMLANSYSKKNGLSFQITAIDAAEITPFKTFQHQPELLEMLQGIEFAANTYIESMPFESESFDLICSQFGYEYSNLNIAVNEVLRLLKPVGNFVAICHHKNSAITHSSCCGLEVLDYILYKTPIFPVTEVIIKLASQALPQLGDIAWANNTTYQVLRSNVIWLLQEVRYRYSSTDYHDWINDVSNRINSVFENCNIARIHDLERFLAFHYRELSMHRERIAEQCNIALDERRIVGLEEFLLDKNVNFEANVKEFEDGAKVWELLVART